MNWNQITAALRGVLLFGAGYLVARGWITQEMVEPLVGAVLTIGTTVAVFYANTHASTVSKAAAIVPVSASSQALVGITDPVKPATP